MRYLLTLFAILFSFALSAQEIAPQSEVIPRPNIKERLASPAQRDSLTVVNEVVRVSEQGDAAAIVNKNLQVESKAVNGYRIVIFMSNTQMARRDALAAQENFAQLFPQQPSYITYENPYFKVAVGNCTSHEEAMILLGRLRSIFPKAFIMRENIEMSEFAR